MNDITALAQRMKAAAEKAIADEGQTWWSEEQLASDYGLSLHPADAKFIALASHENVKALVEALEKAQEITAAAEKLVRCKGRYHSEQNYRALAALFGVKTPDLPQLESESRTVTVKLPTTRFWAGMIECYEKADVITAIREAGGEISND